MYRFATSQVYHYKLSHIVLHTLLYIFWYVCLLYVRGKNGAVLNMTQINIFQFQVENIVYNVYK